MAFAKARGKKSHRAKCCIGLQKLRCFGEVNGKGSIASTTRAIATFEIFMNLLKSFKHVKSSKAFNLRALDARLCPFSAL